MFYKIPTNEEMLLLDNEMIQIHWVKIEILDMDENPIQAIQGKVKTGGSISIDSSSSVRRTTMFSFVAEEDENANLEQVESLLSLNKRIRIFEGIENNGVLPDYPDIIWIPQGIFVLIQPSIQYNSSGLTINISCKDKMSLLNGEVGGIFPTSVILDSYDQIIGYKEVEALPDTPNTYTIYFYGGKYYRWSGSRWEDDHAYSEVGTVESVPQRLYDIIQTAVCNYGGIPISKIFINDLDLELKQLVRLTGASQLFYNVTNGYYTLDSSAIVSSPQDWKVFEINEDVGYVYTDFVYPGELVTAIGDNVCTVLDKICDVLGNFEYFFDINGNFIFQEVKNYLNNSYDPSIVTRLDNARKVEILSNGLSILDDTNYILDVKSNSKSAYTFNQGNGLITSYSNTPNYANIKNDFHIWGKMDKDSAPIHYHVAIKRKPTEFGEYLVAYLKDKDGNLNGKIRLATEEEAFQAGYTYDENGIIHAINNDKNYSYKDETLIIGEDAKASVSVPDEKVTLVKNASVDVDNETLILTVTKVELYQPQDWRAELYLRGLTKKMQQLRPDVYEQELLDLFDDIYDFVGVNTPDGKPGFKYDYVTKPNNLNYFFDYLEPVDNLYDYSIDVIGNRLHSYQQEKIKRLYNLDVPNLILIDMEADNRDKIIKRCQQEGQSYANVSKSVYEALTIGTWGYTAQETMRELLYQHTSYNESITISCIPVYHLDVNTRITVEDINSGIFGDYIIKTISLPLGGQGTMTITATRALERI